MKSTKIKDEINKLPDSFRAPLSLIKNVALINCVNENKIIKISKEKIEELYYNGLPDYKKDRKMKEIFKNKNDLE